MNKLNYLLLILFIITISSCHKNSDKSNKAPLVLNEFQQDFKQMVSIIKTNHPALYDFTNQTDFENFIENQYNKITDETTTNDFFTLIAPVIAKIGCGHSGLRFPSDFNYKLLPIKVLISKGEIYIHQNYSTENIPIGAKITSINNISSNDLLLVLMEQIAADGYRTTGKEYLLGAYFSKYLAINYGNFDQYLIKYRYDEQENEVRINARTEEEIQSIYYNNYHIRNDNLEFELNQANNTAQIRIRTFGYYDKRHEFNRFVDNCFSQIQSNNIENLILDVRGNSGGDPYCANYLLKYLCNKPFIYFSQAYGGMFDLSRSTEPVENPFNGNVYVLINGGCFSTTGHLCALMKYHNIGTFVGQETNGGFSCNDGSRMHTLTHSKISFSMATMTFQVAVDGFSKNQGIVPNHIVELSVEDIKNNIDTELKYVENLIKRL